MATSDISRREQLRADGVFVLATLVWGSTFVLVKDVVEQVSPLLFLAVRFAFGAVALALMLTVAHRWRGLSIREVGWGAVLGFFLWAGYAFQTVGIQWTTASNAGFITGLSVVLVPVLGLFVLRSTPDRWAWAGVFAATVGLAMLSLHLENGLSFNKGDILVLGCAVSFAAQIVLVSKVAKSYDPIRLTFVQILTAGALNAGSTLLFERPVQGMGIEIWGAAAFLGIVATAMAIGAQVSVQRFTSAVHTALIFTLEPVFAAIFSFWLQGDRFSGPGLLGAALILAGMLVAELGPQLWEARTRRAERRAAAREIPHQTRTDLTA